MVAFVAFAAVAWVNGPSVPVGASDSPVEYEWKPTSVTGLTRWSAVATSADGSVAIAGYDLANNKVRITRDSGATWSELASSPSASWNDFAMSADGTTIVLAGSVGTVGNIWVSSDSGATFTLALTASPMMYERLAINADGSRILVLSSAGVLLSANRGSSFTPISALTWSKSQRPFGDVAMTADGTTMYAAEHQGAVKRSTDSGGTWEILTEAGVRYWTSFDVSGDGKTLLGVISYSNRGIRVSNDSGANFAEPANVGQTFANQLATGAMSSDGKFLVSTSYGTSPMTSNDGGATWKASGDATGWLRFAFSGNGSRAYGAVENVGVLSRVPVAAPTVTGITGMLYSRGGATIDIIGTDFVNVSSVTVAGASQSYTVLSRTAIRVTPGAIATPSAEITVTTASGSASTTATVTFPGITSVNPSEGPTTGGTVGGGTTLLVAGNFLGITITSATIGGKPATITSSTNSYVQLAVPPGSPGTVDVVLETNAGQLRSAGSFTYYALNPPSIETVSPPAVSWKGGETVTLKGPGLGDVSAVTLAGKTAMIVGRDGRGEIRVVAPPAPVGTQEVTLTNPMGSRTTPKAIRYSWEKLGAKANWTGLSTTPTDGALGGSVYDIVTMPNGDVIAGGSFMNAAGIPEADFVARWNGSSWSALGSNGTGDGALNSVVFDLAVEADGALIAVGDFSIADGVSGIARFAGGGWTSVAGGLGGGGRAVAVAPDGDLYVGGPFTNVNSMPEADFVVRWDRQTNAWQSMGSNGSGEGALNNIARSFAVTADGVVVGGHFSNAAGIATADYIARWNGSTWSAIGSNGSGNGALPAGFVTTAADVKVIDGIEVILAGTCRGGGGDGSAQLFSNGQWTTVGGVDLNDCVRDAQLMGDGRMVLAGWFSATLPEGNVDGAVVGSDARGWESLGDNLGDLETIHIDTIRNRMFIGSKNADMNADNTADYFATASTSFLDRNSLTVVDPGTTTVTSAGGSMIVLTGSGFGPMTGATIGDVPVSAINVMSPTQLSLNVPSGLSGTLTLSVYGTRNVVSFPNAIVVSDPVATPPTTTPSIAPKVDPPSTRQIENTPASRVTRLPEELRPGTRFTANVRGFTPGAWVYAYVASKPVLVGTALAKPDGTVQFKITMPKVVGRHSLVFHDPANGILKRQLVTIGNTELPATGTNLGLFGFALLLTLVGSVMVAATRRVSRR